MIEFHAVTRRFGPLTAVHEVTFTARPGQVTAVVGPNGSGTSTVLRLAAGRLEPDAGRVRTAGAPGALLDGRSTPAGTAVRAYLQTGTGSRASGREVDDVLAAVGLGKLGSRPVEELSPGAWQLVGLAAALLGDPPVLVLDQPTAGLDQANTDRVRDLVRRAARAGRTVLVGSHDPAGVVPPADRLVVLRAGRVIADVATDDPTAPPPARVLTPDPHRLASLFATDEVRFDGPALIVTGHATATIAQLASAYAIPVHELTPLRSVV